VEDARIAEIVAEAQASVDAQQARVDRARQELTAAEAEVRRRENAVVEANAAIARTDEEVTARAVDAFVHGFGEEVGYLGTDDMTESSLRMSYLGFSANGDRDVLDELRRLKANRELDVEAGEAARQEAERLRVDVEDELAELEARRQVEVEVQAEVQRRIGEWQAEAERYGEASDELTELIRDRQLTQLGVGGAGQPSAESVQGFAMPANAPIGSPFGLRVHPIFGSTRMHTGVDMAGPTGSPIWASKAGRVIHSGWKGGYGNTVVIQHEGNVATLYAHMSQISSGVGDFVEQGEVVGLMGSTGNSTGPHLHFEVRIDGVPKDPKLFLPV